VTLSINMTTNQCSWFKVQTGRTTDTRLNNVLL
jgi:hypothetical protein